MSFHISTRPLTDREWEEIDAVLQNEIDVQSWYVVTVAASTVEEILVPIQ